MEFLRASTKYLKIASKNTTLRLQKVMLLVGRSSKNTYVRHHIKLWFLKDVLAKTFIYKCLKSLCWKAILKYLMNVLRNSTIFEA